MKLAKSLLRSRSVRFARHYAQRQADQGHRGEKCSVTWWNGDGKPVQYRRGTSDVSLVYDVLFKAGRKSEYWLPQDLEPSLILDIGGNIGVVARYLSYRFPRATIHSFEPIPGNVAMLSANVAGSGVVVHPYGLGRQSGVVEFAIEHGSETNWAGYSMLRPAGGDRLVQRAEVKGATEVLAALGGGQVDLIKIDAEGAEREILDAMPDKVLAGATWIYGELHGGVMGAGNAFEILGRLSKWFDVEVHKSLRMKNWFFDACNRDASSRFRDFRRSR